MSETATAEQTRTMVLPPLLDLTQASGLKAMLEEAMRAGGDLAVDASAVQRVTTPCLQVLSSAVKSYAEMGGGVLHVKDASPEFRETARVLGLATLLNLPAGE